MNAAEMLASQNIITVTDLEAAGLTRHQARHQCEALVAEGKASKFKEGSKVSYHRIAAEVPIVIAALRPKKALSVNCIARRCGLPKTTVEQALQIAVALGAARKPFKTQRFARAQQA